MADWNSLPGEIKEHVVKYLTYQSRKDLSACSTNERELVSSARWKFIEDLDIFGWWENINFKIKEFGEDSELSFTCYEDSELSFTCYEEFQANLITQLKKVSSLKNLFIDLAGVNTTVPLKLSSSGDQKILVESLEVVTNHGENLIDLIKQFEPSFLETIEFEAGVCITNNSELAELYDLPQVVNARKVTFSMFFDIPFCENQLLNMKAEYLVCSNIKFSVRRYLKKILLESNYKFVAFFFSFSDIEFILKSLKKMPHSIIERTEYFSKALLDSPHPNMKLEIVWEDLVLRGRVVFDPEKSTLLALAVDESSFRVLRSVEVTYELPKWKIKIFSKHVGYNLEWLGSKEEIEKRIEEVVDHTEYIRCLKIDMKDQVSPLNIQSRKSQLFVGDLEIKGYCVDDVLYALLQKIEPVHLREIRIFSKLQNSDFCNLPQVYYASKVYIDDDYDTDDSEQSASDCNSEATEKLSLPALNGLLKKLLAHLNERKYYLRIRCSRNYLSSEELFKDLEVISRERTSYKEEMIIDSKHPEFVLKVSFSESCLGAERIPRKV